MQGLSLACLVGLLLFLKWDFCMGLLACLLCVAASFFVQVDFVQGLLLACLVGLLVVCGCQCFFGAVGFCRACHRPSRPVAGPEQNPPAQNNMAARDNKQTRSRMEKNQLQEKQQAHQAGQ